MKEIIDKFIDTRKAVWIKKNIKSTMSDEKREEKESEAEDKFDAENWILDAATRAVQISLSSHPCKFSDPDARTSPVNAVYAASNCRNDGYLRTGNVKVSQDFIASASALDVFSFLSLTDEKGTSLLHHIENSSKVAKQALSMSSASFEELRELFLSFKKQDSRNVTTPLVKQVYFPVDDDYHLLSILSPSGMMFEMKDRINDIKFSEHTKEAKKLRKQREYSDHGYDDIPDLTVINFGGGHPKNISILNKENYGKAYLLSSVPPVLKNRNVHLPRYNFFKNSLRFNDFSFQFSALRKLLSNEYRNKNIKDARDKIIVDIVDNIVVKVWEIRQEGPGWSDRENYVKLLKNHKIWLDDAYENERETSEDLLNSIVFEMTRWIVQTYNKGIKNAAKKLHDAEFLHIQSIINEHKRALI